MAVTTLRSIIAAFIVVTLSLNSCTPTSPNTNGVGGGLPTHYIAITNNAISPSTLTVSIGSNITFINQSNFTHTIVSDNCDILRTTTMGPSGYFLFKKDTIGTITYHSVEYPTLRGQITFRP